MHLPLSRISRTAVRAIMSHLTYENWSREDLIARLNVLHSRFPSPEAHVPPKSKVKHGKPFTFSAYPRRKIALKFCYAGWEYNGLSFQPDKTPLPTVEGTLFEALASTRLIDRDAGPQGCGWERCGRTDVGVSAAGQVVSLWVRSNIVQDSMPPAVNPTSSRDTSDLAPTTIPSESADLGVELDADADIDLPLLDDADTTAAPASAHAKHPAEEIRYIYILNRALPPTIRIIAWSPVAPDFSARFACKYRHYKYFFSPHDLDITAMRDAAQRLVGERDFRNLCKLDPSKQITSFRRKVLRADIGPSSGSVGGAAHGGEDIYVLDLVGTAFLYHQVRHIMAVLFLVGCGLEPPAVVDALLNTDAGHPAPAAYAGAAPPEIVDRKPEYQMADALPLMLWECAYASTDVAWRTDTGAPARAGNDLSVQNVRPAGENVSDSAGERSLYRQLHSIHSRALIHSVLDAHFLDAAAVFHPQPTSPFPLPISQQSPTLSLDALGGNIVLNIPIGGGMFRRNAAKHYVPLLRRKRLEAVEVVNERWRVNKAGKREAKQDSNDLVDSE